MVIEPRYRNRWSGNMRYIGGCGRLDMWSHPEHDNDMDCIRIVWGNSGISNWHWAGWSTERPVMLIDAGGKKNLTDPPTEDEMEQLSIYVRLFAPDLIPTWVRKMKEETLGQDLTKHGEMK